MYFRQFVRGMLGVLGIHIWVEEDPSPQQESPKVLVANYTSVLDHIVIDVVISHFVVGLFTGENLHDFGKYDLWLCPWNWEF
jgi:hypothetical protein